MTEEEFRKMFTINKNIDNIPKEVMPIPSKEEARRVLAPKNKQQHAAQRQAVPSAILIYLLLILTSILGYIATKYDFIKLISDALTAH